MVEYLEKDDNEREQQNVLQGNISLVLESYDAIFSDFDPRPYAERMISDDFLTECRRAVHDKPGLEQLRLLIPGRMRKPSEELNIKRRLKEYFKKHARECERDMRAIKRGGILWFLLGSVLLVISTLIFEYKAAVPGGVFNFIFDLLYIISQPAGWFICWGGLDKIFISTNPKVADHSFYKKMENAEIYFFNY